jgi:two-component system, chemotaxis family, protein-glutamate methylesterase/glutaminase
VPSRRLTGARVRPEGMWPSTRNSTAWGWKGRPPRCLVVDGFPEVVSQIHTGLSRILPGVNLLPPARGGQEALERVQEDRPDLLFLDLEMPRMGGLTILRAMSGMRPPCTVVLAPETREGGRAAWEALRMGAADFLSKRGSSGRPRISLNESDLEERLRALLGLQAGSADGRAVRLRTREIRMEEIVSLAALVAIVETRRLMRAARRLSRVCVDLPIPLLLDVPHPPRFTRSIVEGLNRMTPCPVRVAVSGERLAPGHVFLLPAGHHARLKGSPGEVELELVSLLPRQIGMGRHRRSILSLLDPGAAPAGIVLVDRPARRICVPARRAAAQGRLYLLSSGGEGEGATGLRKIERIGVSGLRRVA